MNRLALLALTAGLIGGASVTDLATAIGSAPDSAYLQSGRVVALNGASITVDRGGGQLVDMPALSSYEPVLGDVVIIQQQGPLVVALGTTTAMSGENALFNPSFEIDPPGTSGASSWTFVADSVASSPIAATTALANQWGAAHGTKWLELSSGTVAGDGRVHVVSEPILVQPGESWTSAVYVTSVGNMSNTAALRIAFFSTAAAMYPSPIISETIINSTSFPAGAYPRWLILRQNNGTGVVVPADANYMRVVLSAEIFDIGWVYADAFTARKL